MGGVEASKQNAWMDVWPYFYEHMRWMDGWMDKATVISWEV